MEETMPSVPIDGRAQLDAGTVQMVNLMMGRAPMADVVSVVPGGKVILTNSYPSAAPTTNRWDGGGFSGLAAKEAQPEAPKSGAGALALWPNLK
jgi:hypothetical protein